METARIIEDPEKYFRLNASLRGRQNLLLPHSGTEVAPHKWMRTSFKNGSNILGSCTGTLRTRPLSAKMEQNEIDRNHLHRPDNEKRKSHR